MLIVTILLSNIVWQENGLSRRVQEVMPAVVGVRIIDAYGREGYGSGVIIDERGLILTAGHVVQDASCLEIRLSNGRKYEAFDWYYDLDNDIGIIHVAPLKNLPVAKLGEDPDLVDKIFIIGSPFGPEYFNSVNIGIVSGLERRIEYFGRELMIQLDIAGNPGNSGCPVFDMSGKIVGIVVGGIYGSDGMIFVEPISLCKKVIKTYVERYQSDVSAQGVKTSKAL